MTEIVITLHAEAKVMRKAELLFKQQWLSLESGLLSYLNNLVVEDLLPPVELVQLAEDELTEDDKKEITYTNSLWSEDLIVYSKDGYTYPQNRNI